MAISWLGVLKSVPWSEVITTAPKVAEGAKKLWGTVARKPVPHADDVPDDPPEVDVQDASHAEAIARLEARAAALEAAVSDLHAQMLESSALITTLAEQNARLVERTELNRMRTLWLMALTGVVGIAALLALVSAFGT